MKRTMLTTLVAVVACLVANAQIRTTRVERISLGTSQEWSHPQFSPQGTAIYYTTLDGNGIWEYSLRSRSSRQLTGDAKAGLVFAVSPDGKRIVYRRTAQDTRGRVRRQEVVEMDLASRARSVLASGTDISAPTFSNNEPVYSVRSEIKNLKKGAQVSEITILGIENTKIAMSRNGAKVLLDPLGNGSYVWPVLSPSKRLMVAYEMDRGAFVCDLNGRVTSRIGKRDAPTWTRSGNWIVYMDDKDDGHQILSSDLWAVTPDGKSAARLTATDNLMEMYPHCSSTENKIVCSTLNGEIYLLTYEER